MIKRLKRLVRSSSENVFVFASAALVLSGLMQLATAWLQYNTSSVGAPAAIFKRETVKREAGMGKSYTWIGDDFPVSLDLAPSEYGIDIGPPVVLSLEDSRHYPLDGPDADAEWESSFPGNSDGFVWVGPNKRFFGLSVYHQIHCLDSLRFSILGRHHAEKRGFRRQAVPHEQHCLNYLRQSVLCAADLTLEPEVVLGSGDVEEGLFATHVCRDWSRVHAFVEKNDREYRARNNQTV